MVDAAPIAPTTSTGQTEERRVDGGIKKKTELKDVQQVVDDTAGKSSEVQSWWTTKTAIITRYLKCNLLKIGIPRDGTIEAIKENIARGNKHEEARGKCWECILREVSGIAGIKISDIANDTDPTEAGVRTVALIAASYESVETGCDPIEFEDSPDQPVESHQSNPASEEEAADLESSSRTYPETKESAAPPVSPCVQPTATKTEKLNLKAMTMMERQAMWLQKKAAKARTAQEEQDKRELSEMTGKPKTNNKDGSSGTSSTPSKGKLTRKASTNDATTSRLREEVAALKAENVSLRKEARETRRASNSSSNSTSSKRNNTGGSSKRSSTSNSTNTNKNAKLDKELSDLSGLKNRLRKAVSKTKGGSTKENNSGGPETEDASHLLTDEEQQRLHYLADMARERSDRKKAKQLKAKKIAGDNAKAQVQVPIGTHSSETVGSSAMDTRRSLNQTDSPSASDKNAVLGEVDTNSSPGGLKLPDIRKSTDTVSDFMKKAKVEAALQAAAKKKRTNEFEFDKTSTKDQGKFRIRDSDAFHVNSIFKKRDTGHTCQKQRGVTVVVGTREDNGRQQALSLVFNRDLFDEEKAGQWWEDNGHRFLSPSKRTQQSS